MGAKLAQVVSLWVGTESASLGGFVIAAPSHTGSLLVGVYKLQVCFGFSVAIKPIFFKAFVFSAFLP